MIHNNRNMGSEYITPEPRNFSICALEILKGCSCGRILKQGLYPFDDLMRFNPDGSFNGLNDSKVPKEFFGTNICLRRAKFSQQHRTKSVTHESAKLISRQS